MIAQKLALKLKKDQALPEPTNCKPSTYENRTKKPKNNINVVNKPKSEGYRYVTLRRAEINDNGQSKHTISDNAFFRL